jgi:hypothetical protein
MSCAWLLGDDSVLGDAFCLQFVMALSETMPASGVLSTSLVTNHELSPLCLNKAFCFSRKRQQNCPSSYKYSDGKARLSREKQRLRFFLRRCSEREPRRLSIEPFGKILRQRKKKIYRNRENIYGFLANLR